MRAARCVEYGTGTVVLDIPEPVAGPGQVLIAVRAAAANFPDVLITKNAYQVSIPLPFTVGSEFAGEVVAVGPGVDASWMGRAVMSGSFSGAFAEFAVVSVDALRPIPDGLDFVEAAAFWVTYATAWHALMPIGGLQSEDWTVVLGAAGGVGLAAVDVAAGLGARVIGAASSAERVALTRARGAVAGIDYATEDLKLAIKRITGPGADVVIDPIGGDYSEQALRSTRWGGRFVVVGFAAGSIPRIPLNLVLLKGVIIRGFEIRTIEDYVPGATAAAQKGLAELVRGGMRPHIGGVYSLADAGQALRDLDERRAIGKLVVDLTKV